jgi:GH24 family phage-related lysozyme (muramidase)
MCPWASVIHHRRGHRWNTAPMTDTPTPAYMTLGEATKAVDASRSTLQRRLKAGDIEGAYRDGEGVWRIPFSGLIAAGLAPRTTPPDTVTTEVDSVPSLEADSTEHTTEVERLRAELEHVKALANERAATVELLREVIEHLSTAIKAGPPALEPPASTTGQRRRWWGGRSTAK